MVETCPRESMDSQDSQASLASLASMAATPSRPLAAPLRAPALTPLGTNNEASLQSALSSMLHSAEDLLAASHGHALALAAEHAEAFRKAQDEAARLREENRLYRMALAERTLCGEPPHDDEHSGALGGGLREAGHVTSHESPLRPPLFPRPATQAGEVPRPSEEPHPLVDLPGALLDCEEEHGGVEAARHGAESSLPLEGGGLQTRLERISEVSINQKTVRIDDAGKTASQSLQAPEWTTKEAGQMAESLRLRRDKYAGASIASAINAKGFQVLPDWVRDTRSRLPKQTAQLVKSQTAERGPLFSMGELLRNMTGDNIEANSNSKTGKAIEYELGLVRMGDERWWILHPLGTVRAILDSISLLMVLYDLIFIPLGFFELEKDTFTMTMEWTVRLFWTMDMFLSFFKGLVLVDGTIEMRPAFIVRRYLKSWFLFDVVVNAFDWMELASSGGGNASITRGMRASRGIRALRLVRLLRLLRLKEVIGMLGERINSHWIQLMFSISKNVVSIVAIAHVIACCWYGIGIGNDSPQTWVRVYSFDTAEFGEAYSMSMLWAISQFLGGTDEITAQNVGERAYNISCLMFGFVMGATFIGNLTSSMTQLHILGSQNASELSLLRQFLCQNKVSQVLMLRVQRNAQHALEEDLMHMEEERVGLLGRVSEPLRIEIHFEMYSPLFRTHSFFGGYQDTYPQVMRRVCHFAMSMATLSPGDIVFTAGEIPSPPAMYIVVQGELGYRDVYGHFQPVEKGQWVSEGTLWTTWTHLGTLVAKTPVRICKLDSLEFRKIVTRFEHDDLHFNPCVYAADFVKALEGDGVSDVWDGEENRSGRPWHMRGGDMHPLRGVSSAARGS